MTWNPETELADIVHDAAGSTTPAYQQLLGRCPVDKIEVHGSKVEWWGVFGHAELLSAAKNFRALSSVTPQPEGPRVIPLQVDPPEHTGYRKVLNAWFTPQAVAGLEDAIRAYAGDMIDDLIARGSVDPAVDSGDSAVDFAEDFAFPYPTRVLCRLLGVPDAEWTVHHDFVMRMDKETGHGLNDPDDPIPADIFGAIMPHLQTLIADHLEHPRDDVVSGILAGEVGDRKLDDGEILNMIITLMLAGHITTTSALGNTVLRLARDPELQQLLREHPDRIPDAIEESLRLDTPQQAMPRKAVADTELGGQTIKTGDYVLLNFASANVDPGSWPDAGTFDLDRADKRHLAFGRGLHQCVGQNLARLELRIAITELLARTSEFALAGPVRRRTWPVLAVESMPLRLTLASASVAAEPG